MKSVLILIVFFVGSALSQTMSPNVPARPTAGWDSLRSMIGYPEIARRAGVEGTSNVAVKLDSAGTVLDVIISGYPIFNAPIENAVKKLKWMPEKEGGKSRSASVFFDVEFKYRTTGGLQKKVLLIEADKP